ncbi:O-methyltransferase [Pyruvatibacter mobilis]|uniref:O-methyltransferase n=1 Tax=Pyruvatibacter mobilis TaxID=1712261 RepID=UPI003BAA78B5
MPDIFTLVDRYLDGLFASEDEALAAVHETARAAGMPNIAVAPNQGKLLNLFAKLIGARRILEFGTLAGYSAIWMGRALPEDGKLISLEYDPAYAEVARGNIARAGLASQVDIRVGAALDTLPDLARDETEPFDMAFLDADKRNYPGYFEWALKLVRPGGLILADNVVRGGNVLVPGDDPDARGADEFNRMAAADPRCEAVVAQQIGQKGHDGLAVIRVR